MAIVKKYKSEVVDIQNPVSDIFIAKFKSDKKFKYKPGQFLHIALDEYDPSQPWPESRCFSMQSNPSMDEIKITFSVKGVYTKRMAKELAQGKMVYLKMPYGDLFSGHFNKDNCVFIAGGTGITPYLSLFTSDSFKEYSHPTLYFGLKDDTYHFYNEELDVAKNNNRDVVIHVLNESTDGRLNIEKIFTAHGPESVYFISGPPEMIKNFKEYLLNSNVPESNVITDDWE